MSYDRNILSTIILPDGGVLAIHNCRLSYEAIDSVQMMGEYIQQRQQTASLDISGPLTRLNTTDEKIGAVQLQIEESCKALNLPIEEVMGRLITIYFNKKKISNKSTIGVRNI